VFRAQYCMPCSVLRPVLSIAFLLCQKVSNASYTCSRRELRDCVSALHGGAFSSFGVLHICFHSHDGIAAAY